MSTNQSKLPERLRQGNKRKHATYSADMLYGEDGNAVLSIFGLPQNWTLEDIRASGRHEDALKLAAAIVTRYNAHDALKSALEEVSFEDGLCGRGTMRMVKEALAMAAERSGE